MADEDKPKPRIILGDYPKSASARKSAELPKSRPTRPREELMPLALRITENAELMQRFNSVIGSDDKIRGLDVVNEVTSYAQSLDPSISVPEGTEIVILMMKIVGRIKGELGG